MTSSMTSRDLERSTLWPR